MIFLWHSANHTSETFVEDTVLASTVAGLFIVAADFTVIIQCACILFMSRESFLSFIYLSPNDGKRSDETIPVPLISNQCLF